MDTLPPEADSRIQMMTEKPDVTYDVRTLLELTCAQLIAFLSCCLIPTDDWRLGRAKAGSSRSRRVTVDTFQPLQTNWH